MEYKSLHDWDVTVDRAREIQRELAPRVKSDRPLSRVRLVAGADAAYGPDTVAAAVVVLRLPSLETAAQRTARLPVEFPYAPGLLAFREGPALLECFAGLESAVDAVLFDAHGIAHPRGLGLASHLGLLLDAPTVGCAKNAFGGRCDDPGGSRGDWSPIVNDAGRTVGLALRTRAGVRPVYVSPGHLSDLESCRRLVLDCCSGYRIPEPLRRAHALAAQTL